MDTSAFVAALVADHEHHLLARPHLRTDRPVPAIVLAETFAQLRRTFRQPASAATDLLAAWTTDPELVLSTTRASVVTTFARAVELDLGGNIHDALIARTCGDHGVALVTLDQRQHRIALALAVDSTYLLA